MNTRHLRLFLALLVLCALLSSKAAFAAPPLKQTYSATLPSSFAVSVKRIRVAPDGSVYAIGTVNTGFSTVSADGSTVTTTNYSVTFPSPTNIDFSVSGNSLYIATTVGANGRLMRYDLDGVTTANLVASTNQSGTGAVALSADSGYPVYSSRSSGIKAYNTTLSATTPTTSVSASISRMAVTNENILYYISSAGALRRSTDFTSATDVSLISGLGNVVSMNSLVIAPDSSAAYIGYSTSIRKYSLPESDSPVLLWTQSYSNNLTAMDLDSSGNIYTAETDGILQTYSPIYPITSFSTAASENSANLTWTNDSIDSDFSGVTIRRSDTTYPTSITDGSLVSSNVLTLSYMDNSLSSATTYYYTVFNETVDGFYSAGVTSNVMTPPSAPVLAAELSSPNSSTIHLSWNVPAGTNTFNLQRSFNAGTYTAVQTGIPNSTTSYNDTGLSDGTYIYQIFALDASSNSSSAGISSAIAVDTTPSDGPTNVSADVDGITVLLNWINPVTDFGSITICRSTSAFPTTISDGTLVTGLTGTTYEDANLALGTYYYSLFAIDDRGNVSVPSNIMVVVSGNTPTVLTGQAEIVGNSGANLVGSIDDIGTSSVVTRGFQWGKTTSYGLTTQEDGTFTAEEFVLAVTDLDCATTYHYRAFATNGSGTSFGQDSIFATSACANAIDLHVSVEAPTSPVEIGSTATFIVTINNSGTSDSNNTELSLTLSDNIAFVSAEITGTSSANESSVNASTSQMLSCSGTNPVSCNMGTVAAGSSVTLNITVLGLSAGPMSLSATVGGSSSGSATTGEGGGVVDDQRLLGGGTSCALSKDVRDANFSGAVFFAALLLLWLRHLLLKKQN